MNKINPDIKRFLRSAKRKAMQFPPIYILLAIYRCIKPPLLSGVEIETTTICTRKCNYCPNSFTQRPRIFMQEKTFFKIVDDLKKMRFKGRISPHFYGEPLCDARLEKFISYIKTELPKCTVMLFTNGDLLTFERFESLKDSGVDIFNISNHDKKLNENIGKLKIRYPDLIEIRNFYDNYCSDQTLLQSRGGLLNIPKKISKGCYHAGVNQMTIDYLGNAVLCCNDYNSSVILGNVNKENVKTIWYRHRFRRAFIMNGLWLYPICKRC